MNLSQYLFNLLIFKYGLITNLGKPKVCLIFGVNNRLWLVELYKKSC